MTPKTGRIRFCGSVGDEIYLSGLSTYTKYTASSNAFSSTKSWVKVTVDSTGYTPYVYACFSDDVRNLGVVGSDFAYTKTCTDDVLKVGESGYMTIPSETFYNNWKSNLIINVDGVEFAMVAVSGHSDGFFLIGETEVTKGLYYKLTNDASTTDLNYPISNITYDTFKTAVTQLNTITELEFSLPTKDQWQYASKGGSLSQGYTYSGSNDPEEVAWYVENSYGDLHPVKQLAPNELGIYDMCGNVFEYTSTLYSTRYSYSYYMCGGSSCHSKDYADLANSYYNSYSSDSSTASAYFGYRLILTFN
jgi:formylglycine-generating enzyme required for sulfatase activity